MAIEFEKNALQKRLKSMLAVDFRRMFTSPLFYIMLAISLVIPILILVMTTMMDGAVSVNPQTGEETIFEGFDNVWQILGAISGSESVAMTMDITSMCNINMMFFIFSVFVAIFVSDDFRSGYAKNLFTVRAKKDDYIISKTISTFVAGASFIFAFFVGAMLGGAIANLPFTLEGVSAGNIVLCLLSKMFLVSIFAALYVLASVVAKQRLWMSILIALGVGMLFYTMVPIITPLNSGAMNLILCAAGSAIFAYGIGVGSYFVLKKTDIV